MAFEKEASSFQPQDIGWTSVERNTDLEIYCNDARITKLTPNSLTWRDAACPKKVLGDLDREKFDKCYDANFVLGSGKPGVKAMTRNCGAVDYKAFNMERLTNPNARIQDYSSPTPTIASSMDICLWFSTHSTLEGWSTVTAQRIDECKTDDFKAKLQGGQTPMDGLKTFGCTILHELTHTIQGGRLVDVPKEQLPAGFLDCFGWLCSGALNNERNADSIALLALSMKIWSLKHYAEDDGTIHLIP
ncbi:hypothetical protein BKA65DRAFT_564333 [Rhexocercosporidium sp. MPI-PUGE-AT-0058]|nr:hypothetical protein BKA65DRAFT_564333 [Rhexocercosporidium sp. MPI-PUGE-AT-0058]